MNAPLLRPAAIVPAAGVYPDFPAEDYFAVEAMSASGAKKMIRSPAHYRLARDKPADPTDAMRFGTVVHLGVLEPARYRTAIAIAPDCDRRTKDGKALHAEFQASSVGKVCISRADFERAERCIDAVHAHPAARALLEGAATEVSMFWHDGRFGVPCKCRHDIRNHGGLVDLKTCQDASPEGFARQAANMLYHVQAAHYIDGEEHLLDASPEFFVFIAVESEEPHAVACHALPGDAILAGRHLMNIALERYAAALKAGAWPGYPPTIETLRFPKWATRFDA